MSDLYSTTIYEDEKFQVRMTISEWNDIEFSSKGIS